MNRFKNILIVYIHTIKKKKKNAENPSNNPLKFGNIIKHHLAHVYYNLIIYRVFPKYPYKFRNIDPHVKKAPKLNKTKSLSRFVIRLSIGLCIIQIIKKSDLTELNQI